MNRFTLTFLLVLITLFGFSQTIQTRDSTAIMYKLTENVFVIIHDDATDEWPHGNTGVIVDAEGVFVIDACYLPSRARADIELIRSVTKAPVKYLAFTHWHFDHNNGAIAYKEAFPDITIISERESQKYIELNANWWSKMSTKANGQRNKSLNELIAETEKGIDTVSGKPYTAEEITKRKRSIAMRKNEMQELKDLKVIKPDKTFDNELTIQLGKRTVILKDHICANSPHDVTFYLPDEKILFAGDIIVQTPLPYVGASWPVTWIDALKKIENTPVTFLIPGHGPALRDHSYTNHLRTFFESINSKVELFIREGLTLDEIQSRIDMSDFNSGIWAPPLVTKDDWNYTVSTITERAWRCIRGQGGK